MTSCISYSADTNFIFTYLFYDSPSASGVMRDICCVLRVEVNNDADIIHAMTKGTLTEWYCFNENTIKYLQVNANITLSDGNNIDTSISRCLNNITPWVDTNKIEFDLGVIYSYSIYTKNPESITIGVELMGYGDSANFHMNWYKTDDVSTCVYVLKNGFMYIKNESGFMKGISWIKTDEGWKRGIPWIKTSNTQWQHG